MQYENSWESRAVGKTAARSHRPAAFRANLPNRGGKIEGVLEFRSALGSNLSEERPKGNSEPGAMGAASSAVSSMLWAF